MSVAAFWCKIQKFWTTVLNPSLQTQISELNTKSENEKAKSFCRILSSSTVSTCCGQKYICRDQFCYEESKRAAKTDILIQQCTNKSADETTCCSCWQFGGPVLCSLALAPVQVNSNGSLNFFAPKRSWRTSNTCSYGYIVYCADTCSLWPPGSSKSRSVLDISIFSGALRYFIKIIMLHDSIRAYVWQHKENISDSDSPVIEIAFVTSSQQLAKMTFTLIRNKGKKYWELQFCQRLLTLFSLSKKQVRHNWSQPQKSSVMKFTRLSQWRYNASILTTANSQI